ncbi:MAG: hypothetical protein ACK5II_08000 [Paracoccus sp. (in: a-proteobacteria)]
MTRFQLTGALAAALFLAYLPSEAPDWGILPLFSRLIRLWSPPLYSVGFIILAILPFIAHRQD